MTEDELLSRLSQLMTRRTGKTVTAIHPNMSLMQDIGLDSLDLAELVLALEDEFGVSLTDEQMGTIRTVRDVLSIVRTVPGLTGS